MRHIVWCGYASSQEFQATCQEFPWCFGAQDGQFQEHGLNQMTIQTAQQPIDSRCEMPSGVCKDGVEVFNAKEFKNQILAEVHTQTLQEALK